MTIKISTRGKAPSAVINLPTSKSISNRALVIAALAGSSFDHLTDLSNANDTVLLKRLLEEETDVFDCQDAGTSLRFIVSYLAFKNKAVKITGSKRMCERPIGDLVDSLNKLGFNINYEKESGFPPLRIEPIENLDSLSKAAVLYATVSSQYISSLLMIAPLLNDGLLLQLKGKVVSRPYVDMTLSVMKHFGVKHTWNADNLITIKAQKYNSNPLTIEPDFSNASYFYSLVALAGGKIKLPKLKRPSLQGDEAIVDIMAQFGVETKQDKSGITIRKSGEADKDFSYNFTHCPDLAQTIIVLCAALGIKGKFIGLESLKVKETDRTKALKIELAKIGRKLSDFRGVYSLSAKKPKFPKNLEIDTYKDHRMAMAFAPLATLTKLQINNKDVVNKSFPHFWQELEKCGINLEEKHD